MAIFSVLIFFDKFRSKKLDLPARYSFICRTDDKSKVQIVLSLMILIIIITLTLVLRGRFHRKIFLFHRKSVLIYFLRLCIIHCHKKWEVQNVKKPQLLVKRPSSNKLKSIKNYFHSEETVQILGV